MGFNSSSGQTTAAISGGLTVAQKAITGALRGRITSAGTSTLGTVGAGKKWTILTATISGSSGVGQGETQAYIAANGVRICEMDNASTATATTPDTVSVNWDISCAPVITAGQTVTLTTDNNCLIIGNVTYIEEAV